MNSIAPEKTSKANAERILSEQFSQIFHAYMESSDEVQAVIYDMCEILNCEDTDADDREAALATLAEALFPISHHGELGIDIADLREVGSQTSSTFKSEIEEFDAQDRVFSERLKKAMKSKGVSQEQLAEMVGVRQPAISMMLNRTCHPQRGTVKKLADALGISCDELWPN